jgi:hypothetical protein
MGFTPAWSPDGTALLFQGTGRRGTTAVLQVPFARATGTAGRSIPVFDEFSFIPGCCDLAADGRALALVQQDRSPQTATVIVNWPELMRRAPGRSP